MSTSAATLTAYRHSTAAGNVTSTPGATWTSSNASVATVDGNGAIYAVGIGTATITGTYDGHTATATFTVTPAVGVMVTTLTYDYYVLPNALVPLYFWVTNVGDAADTYALLAVCPWYIVVDQANCVVESTMTLAAGETRRYDMGFTTSAGAAVGGGNVGLPHSAERVLLRPGCVSGPGLFVGHGHDR